MLMLASLLCGLVFGAGLLISQMVQPTKVLAFLDIFGAWDPSLIVVMVAALAVSAPGFVLARRSRPVFAEECAWPTKTGLDQSAGDWICDVRRRLGSRRLVPGSRLGKPRDIVTRCGHVCRRDDRWHVPARSLAKGSTKTSA